MTEVAQALTPSAIQYVLKNCQPIEKHGLLTLEDWTRYKMERI